MESDRKFDELCNKVRFCTRCIRMEESARVLSRATGTLKSTMMFVGEAPGRLGADASEIPFHGDKTGHNFEELLAFAGLNRGSIYVTNAVLCNPKAASGNNATPIKQEIENCSSYLKEQIELVDPKIVVTLGAIALHALTQIEPHTIALSTHVRTVSPWYKRKLIPLYHPGARAMIHRSMANQRSDYQFVAEQARRLEKGTRKENGSTNKSVAAIASEILRRKGAVSYFELHKIVYLVECEAWKKLGHQLTGAFFLRQKDGPYCTDLHLAKLRKALPNLLIANERQRQILRLPQSEMFDPVQQTEPETSQILGQVLEAVQGLNESELKTRVYLSGPMRHILRQEKSELVNLYNTPISFEHFTGQQPRRFGLLSSHPDLGPSAA